MARRSHRIPAAFLKHPPPSWGGRRSHRHRRNPIIRNHAIIRNPGRRGGPGMMTWVIIGGAAFLFLTPQGRAMASSLTRGLSPGTTLPAGVPAGSVRLPDGTYRTPTGQILGTPTTGPGSNIMGQAASLIPAVTNTIASWIRGLASGSSATTGVTPGTLPPLLPLPTGSIWGGAEPGAIPTGSIWGGPEMWGIGEPLPDIPDTTIPDLTFSSWWEQPTDLSGFWGSGPTSEWLGAGGAELIPSVTLTLAPGYESFMDGYDLVDPFAEGWSGFMGLGRRDLRYGSRNRGFSRTLRQPPSYR